MNLQFLIMFSLRMWSDRRGRNEKEDINIRIYWNFLAKRAHDCTDLDGYEETDLDFGKFN